MAYELYIGPLQHGCVISHRCQNLRCVNPDHLVARRKQFIHKVEKGGTGKWWPKAGTVPMTAERLRNLIWYDPLTGRFIWRVTRGCNARSGRPVGRLPDGAKRISVQIEGKLYRLHRLAWLYVYGHLPPKGTWIDHIDGDPKNNRIANLRLATPSQNGHNRKKMKRNTSGYKGVTFNKQLGKYVAMIMAYGNHHYLGAFDHPKLAHDAYCEAALRLHGEFARTE